MTDAVGANGGKVDVDPGRDHGLIYDRCFAYQDRHIREPMWMDAQTAMAQERLQTFLADAI